MDFSALFIVIWFQIAYAAVSTTARLDTLELDDIPSQVIDSGVLNNTVVFGYTYQSGIKVDDIAWDSLTHLVLAFFQVEPSGDVRVSSSSIDSLVAAAHKNNVKVLGSIGGAGNGSALLTKALSASKGQDNLAKSLAQIIAKFDLDGVDYDLEFPETSDELANLYDGLKAMRSSLKSSFDEYKLLTMTLYSSRGLFGPKLKQTDAKPFSDIVDYGLLMSYDYFGGFSDISAPNSPFYDIPGYTGLSFTSSISAWLKNGWDAKKLVAGFPFYGRTVIVHNDGKLTTQFMPNSGETAPSGPVNKIPGAWTWSDIRDPEKGALKSAAVPNNGWQRFWDKTTMTPWLFHNASSVYLGYDDPESLSIKANYIITEGLGGAMVWMVQYDYNRELESVMQNYTAACSRISLQAAAAAEASSLAEESSLEAESSSSSSSSMSEEENYDFATGKTCEHESDQSAKDFMLLGGSGVYTAMRTACNGQRVFLLSDHMQRITNSYKQVLGSTLEPSYWRSLLLPILKRGLGRVQGESKITVLVGKENLRVQFTELKAQADSHCWVRLIRGHREDPEAKDLKWVHKRERLEQLIKPPVNEVVLVNWDEKRFFEGLSSNFFAVRQAATYSVPEFRNYKLVSAPLSSVLLGTIMKLVLRICEEDGISVEFVPQLEPELWAGAFVTSTSRLVLPIENVVFGDDGQHEQRLSRDNPLVMHLKLRVEQLMAEQSEVMDSSIEQNRVDFSTKAIVVSMRNEDDIEGIVQAEDIPSINQLRLSTSDGGRVKRTIICNSMVAYEMQTRPSQGHGQVYQICARTIEGKTIFPINDFTASIQVIATHMSQNIEIYGGNEVERFSKRGFWSPRIKMLFTRALHEYTKASEQPDADPSMLVDEIFVTAQISVRPFSMSLTLCAFPFSSMGTCQVRVCKGTRPESFLRDFQLAADTRGLTRLVTPPTSDVILLDPENKRLSQGLLSNFFATRYAPRPGSSQQLSDYMLISAPLETVQRNEMLDYIWDICKQAGIQVSFAGPSLKDALNGMWSGAFIVSRAHLVLPIDTMQLTDRSKTTYVR
ncbi:hypothetical protein IWW42_005480 [Coemansia sp. RSA 1085]|nr:hypothetical protein IWW42_005480 [Coemansia sp. RSA 1085]